MSTPNPAVTDWVPMAQLGLPLQASVPACRVYHTADQSIASATVVALAFDSERFDTDTIHDAATNNSRLTCRTAGKYQITGNIALEANATGIKQALIRLNGATFIGMFRISDPSGVLQTQLNVTTLYDLAVGDYVELCVQQSSGVALKVVAAGNFSPEFSMAYIGPGLSTPVWAPKTTTSPISGGPPASPADGDMWVATNVDAAGTRWAFQYNGASASAYKWEFIGGSPLHGEGLAAANSHPTPGTWLGVVPVLTLPRAGDYLFSFSMTVVTTAACQLQASLDINSTGAPTAVMNTGTLAYAAGNVTVERANAFLGGVAAGVSVNILTWANVANQPYSQRFLSFVPVRIS